MEDRFIDLIIMVIGIATVTAIVLPGRPTAKLITAVGNLFNSSIKAARGG